MAWSLLYIVCALLCKITSEKTDSTEQTDQDRAGAKAWKILTGDALELWLADVLTSTVMWHSSFLPGLYLRLTDEAISAPLLSFDSAELLSDYRPVSSH